MPAEPTRPSGVPMRWTYVLGAPAGYDGKLVGNATRGPEARFGFCFREPRTYGSNSDVSVPRGAGDRPCRELPPLAGSAPGTPYGMSRPCGEQLACACRRGLVSLHHPPVGGFERWPAAGSG